MIRRRLYRLTLRFSSLDELRLEADILDTYQRNLPFTRPGKRRAWGAVRLVENQQDVTREFARRRVAK